MLKTRQITFLQILLLFLFGCSDQTPLNPAREGSIALNLKFPGKQVKQMSLSKNNLIRFTQLVVEVFPNQMTTESEIDAEPIATATIEIEPGATFFEGHLTVPAGDNRFLRARLFETSMDTATISDTTLSYCGTRSDVSILAGQINEVQLDLYPVPIKNKRIVFWLESVNIAATANRVQFPVLISTLDSLRGIQFDLAFEPAVVTTDSVKKNELARAFSNIQFNNISNQGTRFLLFDQTPVQPWIPPIKTACAAPQPLLEINVRLTELTQENVNITMEGAIVNSQNFENLEVYAIPAQIIRESN